MPEKDKIFETKVVHNGIFDFKEAYSFAYKWLSDEGYDILEKKYAEKVTSTGKEVEVEWSIERKISDYFKFSASIAWRILGMTNIETEKNGTKIKMNQGNIEIKVKGYLERDYEGKWEGQAFKKFFRGIYDKHIIKHRIEQYEGKLFGELDEFASQMKSLFTLEGQH